MTHIQLTLDGKPLLIAHRGRLLWNPTEVYKGSNAKPEIQFAMRPNSPLLLGQMGFNARIPVLYKENAANWGDKVTPNELMYVPLPKPGTPKKEDEKARARRMRDQGKSYVPPAGTELYDPKHAIKWAWDQKQPGRINTNPDYGCTVRSETGALVSDVMAYFRDRYVSNLCVHSTWTLTNHMSTICSNGNCRGKGWDVTVVFRPYIYAGVSKYGGCFKLVHMTVNSTAASVTPDYDFSALESGGGTGADVSTTAGGSTAGGSSTMGGQSLGGAFAS